MDGKARCGIKREARGELDRCKIIWEARGELDRCKITWEARGEPDRAGLGRAAPRGQTIAASSSLEKKWALAMFTRSGSSVLIPGSTKASTLAMNGYRPVVMYR